MDNDKLSESERRAISEAARYMATAEGTTTASQRVAIDANPEHLKVFSAYLRKLADACDALCDVLKKPVEEKVEEKVEAKVEKKVEEKVEAKVEKKVEAAAKPG